MGHHANMPEAAAFAGLFDQQQAQALNTLLPTLTQEQTLWLSGFLAGLGRQGIAVPAQGPAAGAPAAGPKVTVLYATETGNAASVAKQAAERFSAAGLEARAVNMADYKQRDLKSETHVIMVAATHGEGDPPEGAAGFFEFLAGRKAPKLDGVKFAVLGLGDTSYVHFCEAGKMLDRRFEELGAERIAERVDCDVDYEDAAEDWIASLADMLAADAPAQAAEAATAAPSGLAAFGLAPAPAPAAPTYTRKNPFEAEVLDSIRLNGRYSDKETQHIELSLEGSGISFQPGDSLGVIASNDDALVDEVTTALDLKPDAPVSVNGADKPLAEALRDDLELTMLTPGFLKAYAEASGAEELADLTREGNEAALQAFLKEHQVADVVARWPAPGLDAARFAGMLRKLQPRLYSIASSHTALPDEVHLTVGVTRTTPRGRARSGVASTFLADRCAPGEQIRLYVSENENFRMPSDPDQPLIMIGPGTGVAPFRAFMQEREEMGAQGKSWLFFGDRRFREDFLYQTEWQRWLKDGVLTRMDVAFSRDQAEKVYVQDRLREKADEVYAWISDGAAIYVCGDADSMAPAVHEALAGILQEQGGYSAEDAETYLKQMQRERRYQRDVY
ncbi:assimilatory sulfite reductase (NADPH) flavoprotein subunit [Dichotomicrobium thermohalophilum]|uniref:Sulfite reductase [NADPH] flavoprotein alpha-component n=1 Tax=Dichotomicrobium thermohalophilum TaxID=933063 RepID=A0A397Q3X3_9HYPH|nr:assimilatory sulfite reductase (NADPH) flavoprotein subunit [Dichotomicrobium thermohalophilum]RIA55822.1 sulfite reductase (NADPH) alpha subunit [Dichotomicrobium thermohalophilum]